MVSEPPVLFPDLHWVWGAYCWLSERRGVGPNGPVPISAADMSAYIHLTARHEQIYREQLLDYIPELDRVYLKDFYDKQAIEMAKAQKKAERGDRRERVRNRRR